MRLVQIKIRPSPGSQKSIAAKVGKTNNSINQRNNSGSPTSTEEKFVGSFWFVEGDLDIAEAKAIARRMEREGYSGQHFHGKAAEQLYKRKNGRQQARVKNLKKHKHDVITTKKSTMTTTPTTKPVASNYSPGSSFGQNGSNSLSNSGRSYGLLYSDDEDEDMADENEELTEVIPPMLSTNGLNGVVDSSASSKTSVPTSPENQISTQTAQSTTRDVSPSPDVRGNEELSPIMPGSFVFDEEAPASPSFSCGHQESQSMLGDYLHRTPTKPGYVNPGIAIEGRYNAESPLPPSSKRTDLSPYHFAYFLRKKSEMERHAERSMTPSLMSDSYDEDWGYSERERAERERKRRDLARFRQEKQRRLIEERGNSSEASSNKRSRDVSEAEPEESVESPVKKSKSSALFESILKDRDEEVTRSRSVSYGLFDAKSSDDVGSETEKESSTTPKASFVAPTPSPSPSPPPATATSSQQSTAPIAHAPKVSSSLRNVTSQSSPASSPRKGDPMAVEPTSDELAPIEPVAEETMAVEPSVVESAAPEPIASNLSVADIVNQIPDDQLLKIEFPPYEKPHWASWDPAIFAALKALS